MWKVLTSANPLLNKLLHDFRLNSQNYDILEILIVCRKCVKDVDWSEVAEYFLQPEKYTFSLKINNILPKQANLTK